MPSLHGLDSRGLKFNIQTTRKKNHGGTNDEFSMTFICSLPKIKLIDCIQLEDFLAKFEMNY